MIAVLLAAALTFHPMQIGQLAHERPEHWSGKMATHVCVRGWPTYEKLEEDGDHHVRICDDPKVQGMNRSRCLVGEVIPAVPLPLPEVGKEYDFCGVTRWDGETPNHGWWELHPLLSIMAVP